MGRGVDTPCPSSFQVKTTTLHHKKTIMSENYTKSEQLYSGIGTFGPMDHPLTLYPFLINELPSFRENETAFFEKLCLTKRVDSGMGGVQSGGQDFATGQVTP